SRFFGTNRSVKSTWKITRTFNTLRNYSYTFIDRMFKIIPHPFFQCVVIKAYNCGTELYVLFAFIIANLENKCIYWGYYIN
ncbi:hypothetical protein MXB_4323, partial [Myxobolus squamalis]